MLMVLLCYCPCHHYWVVFKCPSRYVISSSQWMKAVCRLFDRLKPFGRPKCQTQSTEVVQNLESRSKSSIVIFFMPSQSSQTEVKEAERFCCHLSSKLLGWPPQLTIQILLSEGTVRSFSGCQIEQKAAVTVVVKAGSLTIIAVYKNAS